MERKKPAIELVKNDPAEARNTVPQSSRPEASKQEKPVLDERGLADMPFLILTVLTILNELLLHSKLKWVLGK